MFKIRRNSNKELLAYINTCINVNINKTRPSACEHRNAQARGFQKADSLETCIESEPPEL